MTLPPAELRARLSLTGTAVEGLEETPAGPLLDAELTINRPDCLGHYGMAREVAALERRRLRARRGAPGAKRPSASANATRVADRVPRTVRALHGARAARREGRSVAGVAAAAPGSAGAGFDQQRRGRHQLRHARTRAIPCTRSISTGWRSGASWCAGRAPGKRCARWTASSARSRRRCA